MQLRSRSPKATIVSLAAAFVGGIWRVYSFSTTARDLGSDASKLSQFIADPPTWLPWTVLVACILVLAWSLWPHEPDEPKPEGGTTVTTLGTHAHGIGSVHGDVHIHPPAAATQPPKSPSGGGWDYRALEGLERLMRGEQQSRLAHQMLPRPKPPEPNMPLNGVLVRVYKALGGAPSNNLERPGFWRSVDLEIQDKIVERGLHVWGRFGRRARELLRPESLKKGWLDHKQGTFFIPSIDSPPMEFTDLCFNRDQVDKAWPEQLETTND